MVETEASTAKQSKVRTIVSTGMFLLLACAFVFACVLFVGNIAKKELSGGNQPRENAILSAQTNAPSSPTPEVIGEAALILVPDASIDSPHAEETPTIPPASATPSAAATPPETNDASMPPFETPTPSAHPLVTAAPFSRENMDVLLLVMDENGFVDWCAVITVRGETCRVVSVPRNTLSYSGSPLSEAAGVRGAKRRLLDAFPVAITEYVCFSSDGLPALTNALDGVTLDGVLCDGAAAMRYLESGGTDELLRIERQQTTMRALLRKARECGLIKLLSLKRTVGSCVSANLTATQTAEAFALMRRIEPEAVRFDVLPVDSETRDGKRFYCADTAAVSALIEVLYGAS